MKYIKFYIVCDLIFEGKFLTPKGNEFHLYIPRIEYTSYKIEYTINLLGLQIIC